jgi:hypothetical protein
MRQKFIKGYFKEAPDSSLRIRGLRMVEEKDSRPSVKLSFAFLKPAYL